LDGLKWAAVATATITVTTRAIPGASLFWIIAESGRIKLTHKIGSQKRLSLTVKREECKNIPAVGENIFGRAVVTVPEFQGNYSMLFYIFVNGIAGIFANRAILPNSLRPNTSP